MAPSLAHFPDLCLESIFKHVPLSDLIYSVGLVCKSWYKSRRTELNKRHRLVLVTDGQHEILDDYRTHLFSSGTNLIGRVLRDDGSLLHTLESREHIKFKALKVPFGRQTIPFIASHTNFQLNITRLHLYFDYSYPVLTEVIQQIGHFSQHLIELKLFNRFDPYSVENVRGNANLDQAAVTQALADSLFAYLNRLQSLKHLQLDLIFVFDFRIRPEQLTWLSRLTTFAIRTYSIEIEDWIFASLARYARNVTSIEVYNIVNVLDIPQFDPQLATNFVALSVSYGRLFDTMEQRYNSVREFCTRFSSLTKLELHSEIFSMPMTMLARCLSLLAQLVHLEMRIDYIPRVEGAQPDEDDEEEEFEEEDEDEENEAELEEEQGEDEQELPIQQEITQVPSVRLLILSFSSISHRHTERLFIPEIFPNLQVLSLENNVLECPQCEIDYRDEPHHITEPELTRRIAECTRLARQPFRRCLNLHTVELVDGNTKTLINVNEL